MKPIILLLVLVSAMTVWAEDPATETEMFVIINRVNQKLDGGDVAALDELKALPADNAVGAYMFFFRKNYYVMRSSATQKAAAKRAAELACENPGAEAFYKRLWQKPPSPEKGLYTGRETAIDLLGAAHTKLSIRLLAEAMTEPDLPKSVDQICRVLAKMDIPSAPFSSATIKTAAGTEARAKWMSWWDAYQKEHGADNP